MNELAQQRVSVTEIQMSGPYKPPPEFKPIDAPFDQDISLGNSELWLVRIQDGQLGPDDFKGKSVKLTLTASPDEKLGSFEDSKGTQFEILDLEPVAGVKPFAFLPENKGSSFNVHKISRQLAIVRSFDPIIFNDLPNKDSSISSAGYGGKRARIKREESQTGSASIGGFSTVESLQEDEERISLETPGKSGEQKVKQKQEKDLEVRDEERICREDVMKSGKKSESFGDVEEKTWNRASMKSSKRERKEERLSLEPVFSSPRPLNKEGEEATSEENPMKPCKKLKQKQVTEEVELSSPDPSQHGTMTSEKKRRKHKIKIEDGLQ